MKNKDTFSIELILNPEKANQVITNLNKRIAILKKNLSNISIGMDDDIGSKAKDPYKDKIKTTKDLYRAKKKLLSLTSPYKSLRPKMGDGFLTSLYKSLRPKNLPIVYQGRSKKLPPIYDHKDPPHSGEWDRDKKLPAIYAARKGRLIDEGKKPKNIIPYAKMLGVIGLVGSAVLKLAPAISRLSNTIATLNNSAEAIFVNTPVAKGLNRLFNKLDYPSGYGSKLLGKANSISQSISMNSDNVIQAALITLGVNPAKQRDWRGKPHNVELYKNISEAFARNHSKGYDKLNMGLGRILGYSPQDISGMVRVSKLAGYDSLSALGNRAGVNDNTVKISKSISKQEEEITATFSNMGSGFLGIYDFLLRAFNGMKKVPDYMNLSLIPYMRVPATPTSTDPADYMTMSSQLPMNMNAAQSSIYIHRMNVTADNPQDFREKVMQETPQFVDGANNASIGGAG